MKKLMIVLGAVAMAMGVQAASVQWGSGAIYTPGTDGAFTSTKVAENSVTYCLWTLTATDYAALKDVTKLDTSSALATGNNSALGGTVIYKNTDKFNAGDAVNWAILFTYTDGEGKEWYIANMGTGTVNDLGGQLTFSNLASASSAYASVSGWTAAGGAIPEPTSGLLMLVGLAGLALKRKRA